MRDVSSRVFLFLVVLSFVVGHVLSVRSVWSQGSPPALSDDFNDNSLDTTKWNANSLFSGYIDLNIPTSETGQRLEIGPLLTNVPDSHYRGIRSVNTYNFSGAYSYVELVQAAPSTTKGGTNAQLDDSSHKEAQGRPNGSYRPRPTYEPAWYGDSRSLARAPPRMP